MNIVSIRKIVSQLILFALVFLAVPSGNALAETIYFLDNQYQIFVVDLNKMEIRLHWLKSDETRFGSLTNLAAWSSSGPSLMLFATNAGIFDPNYRPLGLHVENGNTLVDLNTDNGEGNFFLKPNGIFSITSHSASIQPTATFQFSSSIVTATQSGPILLTNGLIHSSFRKNSINRKVRSGVGVQNAKKVIFAISKQKVNLYDFALLFRQRLKCENALYLDGVISKTYQPNVSENGNSGDSGDFAGILAVYQKTDIKKIQ